MQDQKIIYLKDLLIWDTEELKKMQRMGNSSVTELENELHDLNKRTKLNLKFYKKGEYFKDVDDDEIKTKKTSMSICQLIIYTLIQQNLKI